MEEKLKHLEFIQSTITRMATNSVQLKSLFVTVIVAALAISIDQIHCVSLVLLIPAFVFLLLDTYYLRQERLFRDLFNDIRQKDNKDIDFSMEVSLYKTDSKTSIHKCLFSGPTMGFYLPFIILFIVLFILTQPHQT